MVLKDKLADVAGEEFAGLFDNLTQRERYKIISVYLQYLKTNSI